MGTAESVGASAVATVTTDLPCRDCGYDLRAATWEGRCPECGLTVRASRLPELLHFGSYRSIRRTRLGIGCWAAALALPAVATVVLTVIVLCSSHFWNELSDRQSLSSRIYRTAWYAHSYTLLGAGMLRALAVVLIAAPLAARRERRNPALAWAVTGTMAVGVCADLLSVVWLWSGTQPTNARSLIAAVWLLGIFGFAVSRPLVWAYLATRVDPREKRRLRADAWLATVVSALAVIGAALHATAVLVNPWTWAPTGVVFTIQELSWLPTLLTASGIWDRYGEALCELVMLLVLWAYARTLQAALRGETRLQPRR